MNKFTPGPWALINVIDDECLLGFGIECLETGWDQPAPWYSVWLRIKEPDARLIAAAPELLAELSHLVALLEPMERDGSLNVPGLATLNGARAAIARATGADA